MQQGLLQELEEGLHGIAALRGCGQLAGIFGQQSRQASGRETEFVVSVLERAGEEWQRRKRAVGSNVREFGGKFRDDLLDQKISKGNVAQALQTIIDGIKDSRIGLVE